MLTGLTWGFDLHINCTLTGLSQVLLKWCYKNKFIKMIRINEWNSLVESGVIITKKRHSLTLWGLTSCRWCIMNCILSFISRCLWNHKNQLKQLIVFYIDCTQWMAQKWSLMLQTLNLVGCMSSLEVSQEDFSIIVTAVRQEPGSSKSCLPCKSL